MKELTWAEKEAIYREVQAVYDKDYAKSVATNIGVELTDVQAEQAAEIYSKHFSADIAEYDQMVSAIAELPEEDDEPDDTLAAGAKCLFRPPYEQYAERNGQNCVVTQVFDHNDDNHDISEVGVMYEIKFESDGEIIEAWPEELQKVA